MRPGSSRRRGKGGVGRPGLPPAQRAREGEVDPGVFSHPEGKVGEKRCSRSPRAGNERWRAAGAVTYRGRRQSRSSGAPPVAMETASGLGHGSASCRCQRHYCPGGNRQGVPISPTRGCPPHHHAKGAKRHVEGGSVSRRTSYPRHRLPPSTGRRP